MMLELGFLVGPQVSARGLRTTGRICRSPGLLDPETLGEGGLQRISPSLFQGFWPTGSFPQHHSLENPPEHNTEVPATQPRGKSNPSGCPDPCLYAVFLRNKSLFFFGIKNMSNLFKIIMDEACMPTISILVEMVGFKVVCKQTHHLHYG